MVGANPGAYERFLRHVGGRGITNSIPGCAKPVDRSRHVNGTNSASGQIHGRRPIGRQANYREVILRPAGDDDHLSVHRDLPQRILKPVQPDRVGVNEVIV